jgi:Uma2 family endonuclease
MATSRVVLTYEDYAALPDDGRRYEIHEGVLSVTPAPGTRHQRISAKLYVLLRHHVEARSLGEVLYAPVDVILSPTTVVQPDLLFVETARAAAVSARGIEGPPSLVVEIISPSTPTIDRRTKLQLYARHRVPHYWIVDPDARAIDGYELVDDVYRLVLRASGAAQVALPPFPDLIFAPESLWP